MSIKFIYTINQFQCLRSVKNSYENNDFHILSTDGKLLRRKNWIATCGTTIIYFPIESGMNRCKYIILMSRGVV